MKVATTLVASGFAVSCLWQSSDQSQRQQQVKELCNCELWISVPDVPVLSQRSHPELGMLLAGLGNSWNCAEVTAQTLPQGCHRSRGRCRRCRFLIPGFVTKQHQLLSMTYFTLHMCGALVVAGNLPLSLAAFCLS